MLWFSPKIFRASITPTPIISFTFSPATPNLAIDPAKVSADALAEPLKVAANCSVTSKKDLVDRSALDIPTPKRVSAVLLPR